MSTRCNKSTPTGPCRRRVAAAGAPCGVDHNAQAKVPVGAAAKGGTPSGPPVAASAPNDADGHVTPELSRAFQTELARRLAEIPPQEPSPKQLEMRQLKAGHDATPAETGGEWDRKNRYQQNPLGDGRDVWTEKSGMLVRVKRAESASEADNAKLRNAFVAARPVSESFRPGNQRGVAIDADLSHAMQSLDRRWPDQDARYARLNLQGIRNQLVAHGVEDDYINITESDQDNYGTLCVDDDTYGWQGPQETAGGAVDGYIIGLDRHNRAEWDRYVERNERGDPVRLRARFLRDQTTVLQDGDLGDSRWDG